MLNKKKISDIFLRRDDREKKQKPEEQQTIDQSYFNCTLSWNQNSLSMIRVEAIIVKGSSAGQSLPLNCKWYLKTKSDFKEIEGVKTPYYQPCLDDVGATISIYIQPVFGNKIYNGVTLIKEAGPIKIPQKIEQQCEQLIMNQKISVNGKVQAIFSQDQRYQFIQIPLICQIIIQNRQISFIRQSNKEKVCSYKIDTIYPQVQLIRKTFNAIILNLSDFESMKISFSDSFKRDLFTLVIRTFISDPNLQKKHISILESIKTQTSKLNQQNQQQSLNIYQNNQNEPKQQQQIKQQRQNKQHKQSNTHLVLKLDELSKQNQQLGKQIQQLKNNYNIEKRNKLALDQQLTKIKQQTKNYKQQLNRLIFLENQLKKYQSENRFLNNEISFLKKQNHNLQQLIKNYQQSNHKSNNSNNSNTKSNGIKPQNIIQPKIVRTDSSIDQIKRLTQKLSNKQFEIQSINQKYNLQIQRQQDQIIQLKKKIQSLIHQKKIISPIKSPQKVNNHQDKKYIHKLQSQIKNLEMLLKHKSGQKGNQTMGYQQIINRLTQQITQKQIELESIKSVNKQLLKKINSQ